MELQRTKIVKIKGDDFILDITKFRVADYLALEVEKQRLSGSKYFDIATTYFANTMNAANLIDMIATFRVLLPELEKSLNESYEKLNFIDVKQLLSIYLKEVAPWFKSWMDEFNSPLENESVDEK